MRHFDIDWPRLRGAVEHELEATGMTKSAASIEIGLPRNALCRFLKGEIGLGAAAFMNCCYWLGEEHPTTFCKLREPSKDG